MAARRRAPVERAVVVEDSIGGGEPVAVGAEALRMGIGEGIVALGTCFGSARRDGPLHLLERTCSIRAKVAAIFSAVFLVAGRTKGRVTADSWAMSQLSVTFVPPSTASSW